MARKGENIYKRRDGRWEGRYIVGRKADGRARYSSIYGKSYHEVKTELERRKGEQFRSLPNCSLTVKYLMELWLSLRSTEVKASTYQRYSALIERHISPRLGNIRINNLTAEVVSGFIKDLLKGGRLDGRGGLSPKMVSDIVSILRSAIRLAGKKYAVRDTALFDIKGAAVKQPRVETLRNSECEVLVQSILAAPDLTGIAILLALSIGLRLGEVCGLKWSDIHFSERELSVNRTVLRIKSGNKTQLIAQTPKTESSIRVIPLPVEMVRLLSQFKRSAADDIYVLTGRKTPLEPRTLQARFHRYMRNHGLKSIRFHALRHTFATRSIESGFDAKTVSELLGHSSVKTTLQLYVHPTMTHKREVIEAVSFFIPARV